MDDLSQQINQILSDPQSMQQIQGILSSLGGGASVPQPETPAPSPAQAAPSPSTGGLDMNALTSALSSLGGMGGGQAAANTAQQNPLGALGALGGLSSGGGGLMSPEFLGTMTKLAPLLSQINQEDDSTRLLRALRPLLSQARQKKIDEAMKILQMMRLLPLLKESGVFSGLLSGLL